MLFCWEYKEANAKRYFVTFFV